MAETDFLAELRAQRCRGSRSPAASRARRRCCSCRASRPSDVKVVLAGQGADEPHGGYGRHQAAARARAGCGSCPAAAAAPAAALARALPRAARARRAAHLLGGRGDAERLLRLVEITDAPVRARPARRPPPRQGGRRRSASTRRAAILADVAGPRPARAGALPRHAHVPARRDPDLQRQDVDGGRPRAARAVPRRRADALRRAHPGARAGQARAPASASTAWRWSGSAAAAESRAGPSTASRPRTTTGCARRSARRWSAATRPAGRSAQLIEPSAVARLVAEHRRGRADHKAILYCLLELSEWHHAFVEAREPVAA